MIPLEKYMYSGYHRDEGTENTRKQLKSLNASFLCKGNKINFSL